MKILLPPTKPNVCHNFWFSAGVNFLDFFNETLTYYSLPQTFTFVPRGFDALNSLTNPSNFAKTYYDLMSNLTELELCIPI